MQPPDAEQMVTEVGDSDESPLSDESPVSEESDPLGTDPDNDADDSLATLDFGEFQIVVSEDEPAPGAEDENLLRLNPRSIDVTERGSILFTGSIGGFGNLGLWGGTLREPKLLLRSGMVIEGFPANIRVDGFDEPGVRLARDGSIVAIATMSGASTVNTVLLSGDSGMTPVFRSDEAIDFDGRRLRFTGFTQASHANDSVAVHGTESNSRFSLILSQNDTYKLIAPSNSASNRERPLDAVLQPDGCRILVGGGTGRFNRAGFAVREDGSVAFNAIVRVETGAIQNVAICSDRFKRISNSDFVNEQTAGDGFGAVVIYRDGEFNRIVSVGDSVPNMENAVFKSVSLSRVLADGSLLVSAELNDITVRGQERNSRWLFKEGADPRLIMLDGETTDSSIVNRQYTLRVGNISGFGGFDSLDVLPDGSALIVDDLTEGNSEGATWMISGESHPGQPYATLAALGASPLQPVLVTGTLAPDGLPSSAFWSSIGQAQLLPEGGGIFGASIVDTEPGAENPVSAGIWRFDTNGEIRKVVDREVSVVLNGLPRNFSVPFNDGWQLVGSNGILFVNSIPGTNRIIYQPFGP